MMRSPRAGWAVLLAAAAVAAAPRPASAGSSVRYALVIGNNWGRSEVELEPLRHAEADAARLREKLLRYANFDPRRVEMVLGGGRRDILAAALRIADQRRRDAAEMGELPGLFAIFFNGHGLAGRLLTADDPLTGADLSEIVRKVNASLTVGFFDACYAGSLDVEALRSKGLLSTPGFNPVAELPKEVLESEGTVWLVSSRPGQLSYEDDALGSLFTHYFAEAFTAAPNDGLGVTLESMWEYATRRTSSHAARFGRTQTPEKIVRELKSRAPLYFSFPQERTAKLRFQPDVEGRYLLVYDQAALVERIDKSRGAPLEVAVYDGAATLRRVDRATGEAEEGQTLSIAAGSTVLVQRKGSGARTSAPGFREAPIRGKGTLHEVELAERVDQSSLALGLGYRFVPPGNGVVGAPHAGMVGLSFARGPLSLALDVGWGVRAQTFDAWSYRSQELQLELHAGYGLDWRWLRADLEAGAGPTLSAMTYGDGQARAVVGAILSAGARLTVPLPAAKPWVLAQLRAGGGVRFAGGLAQLDAELHRVPFPYLGMGIAVPLTSP